MLFSKNKSKELMDCADAMGYQSLQFGVTDWENLSSLLTEEHDLIKHVKEDFIIRQAIFYVMVTINLILININMKYHKMAINALICGFNEKLNEINSKETTDFVTALLNKYIDIFSAEPDFLSLVKFQKKFFMDAIGAQQNYGVISSTLETFLINSISTFPFEKLFPNKSWYSK